MRHNFKSYLQVVLINKHHVDCSSEQQKEVKNVQTCSRFCSSRFGGAELVLAGTCKHKHSILKLKIKDNAVVSWLRIAYVNIHSFRSISSLPASNQDLLIQTEAEKLHLNYQKLVSAYYIQFLKY